MNGVRPINRRSFLEQVVGTAFAGGAALTAVSGSAAAQPHQWAVDSDPGDPARPPSVTDRDSGATSDPPNQGRGGPEARRRGVTDRDSGAAADPARNGRGPVRQARRGRTGVSDSDPSDPVGNGRAGGRRGITDSDSGAQSDRPGAGRGPTQRFVSCPGHPRCPRRRGS